MEPAANLKPIEAALRTGLSWGNFNARQEFCRSVLEELRQRLIAQHAQAQTFFRRLLMYVDDPTPESELRAVIAMFNRPAKAFDNWQLRLAESEDYQPPQFRAAAIGILSGEFSDPAEVIEAGLAWSEEMGPPYRLNHWLKEPPAYERGPGK